MVVMPFTTLTEVSSLNQVDQRIPCGHVSLVTSGDHRFDPTCVLTIGRRGEIGQWATRHDRACLTTTCVCAEAKRKWSVVVLEEVGRIFDWCDVLDEAVKQRHSCAPQNASMLKNNVAIQSRIEQQSNNMAFRDDETNIHLKRDDGVLLQQRMSQKMLFAFSLQPWVGPGVSGLLDQVTHSTRSTDVGVSQRRSQTFLPFCEVPRHSTAMRLVSASAQPSVLVTRCRKTTSYYRVVFS